MNQGRWLSPDPAGLAAANPTNPQSWNRYAYVVNNPLSLVDPLGLAGGCPGEISGGCESDPSNGYGCDNECAAGQPNLSAITGSGSICGVGGCGADQYAAYSKQREMAFYGAFAARNGGQLISQNGQLEVVIPGGCVSTSGAVPGTDGGSCSPSTTMTVADFNESARQTLSQVQYYAQMGWNWSSNEGDSAAALAVAMNKTGIQQLANPCTIVAWYATSAVVGTAGAGAAGSEAVRDAAEDGALWLYGQGIKWLYRGPLPGTGIIAAGMFYGKLAIQGCNAIEGQ